MAIRLDPKYSLAYYCRGWAYDKKGRYDEAIADYTEAIRLQPQYADAYCARGWAHSKNGEQAKAEADFARARRLGYKGPAGSLVMGLLIFASLCAAALIVGVVLLVVIGRWIAAGRMAGGPDAGWP